jgi:uncharacterized protein (TIGR03083 family)
MNDRDKAYQELAEIVRELQQRLAGEWRRMTQSEWTGITACEGWTSAHIIAHLTFQADFYVSNLARALSGLEGPPFVFGPRGAEDYGQFRDGLIERWTQRAPDDLITEYETRSSILVESAARLTAEERRMNAWWMRGPMPLGRFLEFRLFELAIHDWDIRSGIDPRAEVRPEILPTLVPLLESRLAQFAGPKPGQRAPGTYRLTVERVAPVQWDIEIDEQGLRVQPGGSLKPDATLTVEPNALALVLAGRLPADQADSDWQISGDQAKGQAFGQLFRGL